MKRNVTQVRKRRAEAKERQAYRDQLSPKEQLARIENRRGESRKETERLKRSLKKKGKSRKSSASKA